MATTSSSPNSAGIRFISSAGSNVAASNASTCPTCKRYMTQLFLSQACDYCDYGVPKERLHRGFIVYRQPSPDTEHSEEYVFRTRMDAERWREAAGREGCDIREVFSLSPFRWHLSRGTLRDVVLADHMFEIFQNHKYEPLPHRAHFIPEV